MANQKTLAQQNKFHFKWYMAIILVGIVAVIGILVLRLSHAGGSGSTVPYKVTANYYGVLAVAPFNQGNVDTANSFRLFPVGNGVYQAYFDSQNAWGNCLTVSPFKNDTPGLVGTSVYLNSATCPAGRPTPNASQG